MKSLLLIVLLVVAKRYSEMDFDLPRPPASALTSFVPGPLLFNYNLIHQAATPCRILRCGARSSLLSAVLLIIAGIETNPGPDAIKIGLLNARSVVNKGPLVQDIIISHHLDLLAVTETWITHDDPDAVKLDAAPTDYTISHLPRPTATVRNRGGGTCIIHRKSIAVKQQSLHYRSFECQLVSVKMSGRSAASTEMFSLAVIYRPPSSSLTAFYDELSDFLTQAGTDIDAD